MIRVHHLENSRSQRVLWLLEELGVAPYEVVRHQRDPASMAAPPALRGVHPLGRAPLLEEDGAVLAESGAIVQHLLDRHDPGRRLSPPAGAPWRDRHLHWLHFAEGTAMPPLVTALFLSRLGEHAAPVLPRVRGMIAANLDSMEGALAAVPHFSGEEFGAADAMMSFPAEVAAARAGLGPDRPRLWDWLARMQTRPAYRRALERGGPYAYAR